MRDIRIIPAIAILASMAAHPAAASDQFQDAADNLGRVIDKLEDDAEAMRSRLDSETEYELDRELSRLSSARRDVDSLAGERADKKWYVDSQENTVQWLRIEAESAERRHMQVVRNYEDQWGELQRWNDSLTERIRIHNAQPHDNMEPGPLAAYNAEADQQNSERDSLMSRWEALVIEQTREESQTSEILIKKQREHYEAELKLQELEQELAGQERELMSKINEVATMAQDLLATLRLAQTALTPSGGTSYRTYEVPGAARARKLFKVYSPSASDQALRENTFVIPSGSGGSSLADRIRQDAVAKSLSQYRDITADTPADASSGVADSTQLIRSGFHGIGTAHDTLGADSAEEAIHLSGTVDPRRYVTDAMYHRAVQERDRMLALEGKLSDKQIELKGWRKDTLEYQAEFEAIRRDAVEGAVWDVLKVVPVGEIASKMSKTAKYKDLITPEMATAIQSAIHAMQALDAQGASARADKKSKEAIKAMDSMNHAYKMLAQMPLDHLPEDDLGRKWLDGLGKSFDVAIKVGKFTWETVDEYQQKGKLDMMKTIGDGAQVSAEIAGVFFPPLAIGLAGKSLAERYATTHIIRGAMDDLSTSLSMNYHAERYLSDKIDRLQEFRTEEERTINSYESLDPTLRGVNSIR